MSQDDLDFLPDIIDYNESDNYGLDCIPDNIDHLVELIAAKEHISKDIARFIVINFFSEIRNNILKGNTVMLNGLCKFYWLRNKTDKSKYSLTFSLSQKMKGAINARYKRIIK